MSTQKKTHLPSLSFICATGGVEAVGERLGRVVPDKPSMDHTLPDLSFELLTPWPASFAMPSSALGIFSSTTTTIEVINYIYTTDIVSYSCLTTSSLFFSFSNYFRAGCGSACDVSGRLLPEPLSDCSRHLRIFQRMMCPPRLLSSAHSRWIHTPLPAFLLPSTPQLQRRARRYDLLRDSPCNAPAST